MKSKFVLLVACALFSLNVIAQKSSLESVRAQGALYLYPLYMENTMDHPYFDTLLHRTALIDVETGGIRKMRNLVFQFLHDVDGSLTLVPFVGKRARKDWKGGENKFILQHYDQCGSGTMTDYSKSKFLLSDLEITDLDTKITAMMKDASDHINNLYVVFLPTLDKFTPTIQTIHYSIYFVHDLSEICTKQFTLPPPYQTNPSPPYKGNN